MRRVAFLLWLALLLIPQGDGRLARSCFAQMPKVTPGAGGAKTYDGKTLAQWIADLKDLDSTNSDDDRRRAAYALGRIGPAAREAVPALVTVVNDPNMEPRWYAVDALGRIGGDEKVAAVIAAAIRNPENDVYVRRNAVEALGRLGKAARQQTGVLVEQLDSDDAATRAQAALALWRVAQQAAGQQSAAQQAQALGTLEAMLASETGDQAFQACMALLEMGDAARPATDPLVAVLASPNADARRAAAKVLGGLGLEAAKTIAAALAAPGRRIDRQAAAAALGYAIDRIRAHVLYRPETPTAAFDAAVRELLGVTLPPLKQMLAAPEAEVREAAGRAMARLGLLSVRALLESLESDNADERQSAAAALVQMEQYLPPRGKTPPNVQGLKKYLVPVLAEAMRKPAFEVRYGAVRASAALSLGAYAAQMKPLLSAALEDEDAGIRHYAVKALDDIQANTDSSQ